MVNREEKKKILKGLEIKNRLDSIHCKFYNSGSIPGGNSPGYKPHCRYKDRFGQLCMIEPSSSYDTDRCEYYKESLLTKLIKFMSDGPLGC